MMKIVKGIPLKGLPVPGKTLPEIFLKQKEIYGPNRTALRHKINGIWNDYSWNDYYDNIEKVADGLLNIGIKPLDRICIISANCPEWLFISLAVQSIGACLVPVYPNSTPDQVKFVVDHSEACLLFVQNHEQLLKTDPWRHEAACLKNIILMSGTPSSDITGYNEFIAPVADTAKRPSGFLVDYIRKLTPESPGGIIYTSGTTGPPKGIVITQKNLIFEAAALYSLYDNIYEEDTVSFLPLSHIAEQIQNMSCAIALAFRVSFARSIETIKDDLPQINPTLFFSVPRLYEKVHSAISESMASSTGIKKVLFNWAFKVGETARIARNHPAKPAFMDQIKWSIANRLVFSKIKEKLGLSKTHFFLSGAAFLPIEVSKFFGAMGMDIFEVYGQTECTGVCNATAPAKTIPGAVGPPVPGCDVAIADDGEILIKGDHVFSGYFKDREKTDKVLKNRWLHTGDIGHFDEHDYIYITDRKKDIIVTSGGKNIAPQNIEGLLNGIPCISHAVVIGDKRKYLTCLFTMDEDHLPKICDRLGIERLCSEDVPASKTVNQYIQGYLDDVNAGLARFETIKYFRILPQNFSIETGELTPTLKVKRRIINEKYKHVIDSMY